MGAENCVWKWIYAILKLELGLIAKQIMREKSSTVNVFRALPQSIRFPNWECAVEVKYTEMAIDEGCPKCGFSLSVVCNLILLF